MGETTKPLFVPEFNRSIHIEARPLWRRPDRDPLRGVREIQRGALTAAR
jgi:hypothetical protein